MADKKYISGTRLLLNVLAVAITLFVLVLLLLPFPHKEPKIPICHLDLLSLGTALNAYQMQYSNYPTGKQAEIVKSLLGHNSQKYQFLSINLNYLNTNGEYLDPWRTPYVINFLSTSNFVISSAGKDKVFGDADDVIFNSVSNGFVKP